MEEIHCLHSGEVFRDYSPGAMVARPTKAVAQHLQWMGIVFKSGELWFACCIWIDRPTSRVHSFPLEKHVDQLHAKFQKRTVSSRKFDRFLSSVSTNHIFSTQTWGRSRAGRVAK